MTVQEQLQEVENLIGWLRWARGSGAPEEKTYSALKQIAADLRGRLPGAASEAARELQRRIDAVKQARAASSNVPGPLQGVAEELMGRWPTVRRALEAAEKATADAGAET